MKLTKYFIVTLAMTLLLSAFSAKAYSIIGTVTNYNKLTISLVISTNPVGVTSGNVTKYALPQVKFTNTQLLNLFAHWAGTTWPAQGWDSEWYGDVLVVDKTGTNVLFDATSGYYNSGSYYFYLNIFYGFGSYNGTYSNSGVYPGAYNYTWLNEGYFILYDDDYYLPYTYLYSYGPNTEVFSQAYTSETVYTKWSDSEAFNVNNSTDYTDGMWFLDAYEYTTISGTINSKGSGKGAPDYIINYGY
jgi:hypothetical protein